jgi:hypothetical protein
MSLDFRNHPSLSQKLWSLPSSYAGATHEKTSVLASRTRDGSILDQSNWDCTIRDLTAISKEGTYVSPDDRLHDHDDGSALGGDWYVTRASHWACGWVEIIHIRPTASIAIKDAAELILTSLEEYPILDEADFNEREDRYISALWNESSIQGRIDAIQRYNRKPMAAVSIFVARKSFHSLPDDFYNYYRDCNLS